MGYRVLRDEEIPDFVEIDYNFAEKINKMTRADTEPIDEALLGCYAGLVRIWMEQEGARHVEGGLQVHYTNNVKNEVFEAMEKAIGSENLYDCSKSSELDGYNSYMQFELTRDSDDEPWAVPRFSPSTLFELLRPLSEEVHVIALAEPLAAEEN